MPDDDAAISKQERTIASANNREGRATHIVSHQGRHFATKPTIVSYLDPIHAIWQMKMRMFAGIAYH